MAGRKTRQTEPDTDVLDADWIPIRRRTVKKGLPPTVDYAEAYSVYTMDSEESDSYVPVYTGPSPLEKFIGVGPSNEVEAAVGGEVTSVKYGKLTPIKYATIAAEIALGGAKAVAGEEALHHKAVTRIGKARPSKYHGYTDLNKVDEAEQRHQEALRRETARYAEERDNAVVGRKARLFNPTFGGRRNAEGNERRIARLAAKAIKNSLPKQEWTTIVG